MSSASPIPSRFKFTEKTIARLPPHPKEARSTEAEYSDTEVTGLKLLVSKNGRKFFYMRYSLNGKKRSMKLGEVGAMTVVEARQQTLAVRAQLDQGLDPQAEKARHRAMPTFAAFALNEYLPDAYQRKRSAKTDASKLRVHLLAHFGTRKLDTITSRDIQRYHATLKQSHCAATANRHLALLSKLFKLAVQWGYLETNPCVGIVAFQENNLRTRFLSDAELSRLQAAMETEPNRTAVAAFQLLLLTGLRREEVLQARWAQIDLERGTLFLPQTKNGRSRTVVLNAEAVVLLQAQPRQSDHPYVFPGKVPGRPLNNPYKAFQRLLKAAGITDLRIHDLRHTFASLAVNAGESIYAVQHLLGHSNVQTTAKRYAHLSDQALRQTSNAIGARLKQAMQGRDDVQGSEESGAS